MNTQNFIISIGRELGSGGAIVGKNLAARFGFRYVDNDLLMKAAEALEIPEENLEWIEEKNFSIWGALLQTSVYELPFIPDALYMPTGKKLFQTQSQILEKMTDESSSIVMGRCGAYLFRNHPRHISFFLHADIKHKVERLNQMTKEPPEKIKKLIEKTDKERERYYSTYTGRKWRDLREYDLTVNTGIMSIEEIENILENYIYSRFPELSALKGDA